MEAEGDPAIAAALRRLRADDPAAADEAEHALDWIVGGQGLAMLTQEAIQRFLWYDLPREWMTTSGQWAAIVDALAQALDLLDLPRYSAICRSDTTREVLTTYGHDEAIGLDAFHRAEIASPGSVRPICLNWPGAASWASRR